MFRKLACFAMACLLVAGVASTSLKQAQESRVDTATRASAPIEANFLIDFIGSWLLQTAIELTYGYYRDEVIPNVDAHATEWMDKCVTSSQGDMPCYFP